MTASKQPSGARTRAFRGPRRSAQPDTSTRSTARERLLSLDDYEVGRKPRSGVYFTPGRGVQGESSN